MASQAQRSRLHQPFSWPTFGVGIAMTVAIFALFIAYPRAFAFLDLKITDLRMNARRPRPPTGSVVVVGIDQKSIAQLGHWPWPRDLMARFQTALASYHPKVIGYDILFSESDADTAARREIAARLAKLGLGDAQIRQVLGVDHDEQFAASIRAQGNTFLGYAFARHGFHNVAASNEVGYLRQSLKPPPIAYSIVSRAPGPAPPLLHADAYLPPIPALNAAARGTGFVDIEGDLDGEIRRELSVIEFHGRLCVPFFLAVTQAFYDDAPLRLNLRRDGVQSVALGDIVIPVDEMGRMMVRFHRLARGIPYVSAIDVLAHRAPSNLLVGKIALVGATAKAIGDRAVTPAGPEFPRVEIHANAIDDIIAHDFVDATWAGTVTIERLCAGAIGIAVSVAVAYLAAPIAFAAVLALIAAYFGFVRFLLIDEGVLLGVALPLAVGVGVAAVLAIYRYWTEGREKRYLRHAFEHYLHPDVIASLMSDPGALKLGGERKIITVLFADIVNYTGLSERSDPAALVAQLNDYMTRMTDIIMDSGGVVDKIRGDGIMAFWGAPNEVPNHARAAIDSGLAMLSALTALREHDPRFAAVDIGIGIASGEVIAGNFGGARRFDYSVIGDTVNLASRLEGLTRQFKVHLLASRESFTQAGGNYVWRDIGLVRVKGKSNSVGVVEVAAIGGDGVDPGFYQRFSAAVAELRSGDADHARRELKSMGDERPDDGVIALYLEKLANSASDSVGEFVFEFDVK